MAQSQISRTLRDEAAVSRISAILSQEQFDSRSDLGRRICEEFSFIDVRGRPQLAGCMKALGALAERVPGIALPPPRAPAIRNRPRQLEADVPEPEQVPPHPARIRDLEVMVVANAADRTLWNTLIAREHPHGMTTFAGRQVRYLVGPAHGWLGAAGFSAAALRVAARELQRSWRTKLGVAYVDHAPSLHPGEGLNAQDWAENEFGGAPLGDKRLSARLVKSAGLLAAYPGQKINACSDSGGNEIAGFYRLVEAPAESEVTVPNILAPHRERSIGRMRAQHTILAIQDGTDLNFSRRPGCEGLQLVGKNQTSATSLGLHMHATLAVTEAGLPLGCSGWTSTHRPSSRKSRRSAARRSAGSTGSTISPTPYARSAARRG